MANIEALDKEKHAAYRLLSDNTYRHSATRHLVSIVLHEMAYLQSEYPIVFVKEGNTGQFGMVALLGLKPGTNLFYSDSGWKGRYIPLQLQSYPFTIASNPSNQDNHFLCADFDSHLISKDEGEVLFENEGPSEVLQNKINLVEELVQKHQITRPFINLLVELELLHPQSLVVNEGQKNEYNLTGMYVIDEVKFNSLPEPEFSKLKAKGYLPFIYACLFSIHRVRDLVTLENLENMTT